MSEETDTAARTKPPGSQYYNLPEMHRGYKLAVHDRAQSVQRAVERHIRQLFSNYSQHTLHPACRAKLACASQTLESWHECFVVQRPAPDRPSDLHTANDRLHIYCPFHNLQHTLNNSHRQPYTYSGYTTLIQYCTVITGK